MVVYIADMAMRVPKRAKLWERLWASSILLYTFAATFVVWKSLAKYGVNPIIFFLIDAVTSWTYGIGTARLVVAFIEKNWTAMQKWVWVSGISFITPQIYVVSTARRVPRNDYFAIVTVIAILLIFALMSLSREINKHRK